MRKPKNHLGRAAARVIGVMPKKFGIKKSAKSLVKATNRYDPVGRGRKLVYDTGEKLLYGKKRGKRK